MLTLETQYNYGCCQQSEMLTLETQYNYGCCQHWQHGLVSQVEVGWIMDHRTPSQETRHKPRQAELRKCALGLF